MKAIILAAGFGRRMMPLTAERHKTMIPVGGTPVLGRIVDALVANDVRDLVIVTGYRAEELQGFMAQTYPTMDVTWVHNPRYESTNNIYSLALAFDAMDADEDFLLIESDLIFDAEVIGRLIRTPYPDVALVDRYRMGMDGTVVAVHKGVVTQVIPPHLQPPGFDFSDKYKTLNIYKFSREFYARSLRRLVRYYAQAIDDNCYYELVLGVLIYMQGATIRAEILDGEQWTEVDDPIDLSVAEFTFDRSRRRPILESTHGGYWKYDLTDFCFIRNMHFPTGGMLRDLQNNLPELLHNYGSKQTVLDRKLAYLVEVEPERIVTLNGVAQAFPWLGRHLAGKRVLIPRPTFGEYPRHFPEADTYSDTVGYTVDSLRERLDGAKAEGAPFDALVVVNPNNPSGHMVSTEALYALAGDHPGTLLIVDESFIDFSDEPPLRSLTETRPRDNVLVLTSLSKILGVPGLRLGHVYSPNPELTASLRAEVPIWNLNSLAEYFLEVMFKYRRELERSLERTKRERETFRGQLAEVPGVEEVFPSGGNFVLVRCDPSRWPATETVDRLVRDHAVYVKDVSARFPDGKTYLRLAVRMPHEHDALVELLKRVRH